MRLEDYRTAFSAGTPPDDRMEAYASALFDVLVASSDAGADDEPDALLDELEDLACHPDATERTRGEYARTLAHLEAALPREGEPLYDKERLIALKAREPTAEVAAGPRDPGQLSARAIARRLRRALSDRDLEAADALGFELARASWNLEPASPDWRPLAFAFEVLCRELDRAHGAERLVRATETFRRAIGSGVDDAHVRECFAQCLSDLYVGLRLARVLGFAESVFGELRTLHESARTSERIRSAFDRAVQRGGTPD